MKHLLLLTSLTLLTLSQPAFAGKKDKEPADNANNFRPKPNPTLGLGVGQTVGAGQLDTYTLRVRMNPNLMIEPMLMAGKASSTMTETTVTNEIDPNTGAATGNQTTESSETTTDTSWMGGNLGVRYRIARRGNTDVAFLGNVAYAKGNAESKTQGVTETDTYTQSGLGANIGVGMESFFAPKWSAGFDLTTSIYSTSTSNGVTMSGDKSDATGTSNAFNPTMRLMLVHYF